MKWSALALFAGVACVGVQACNNDGRVLKANPDPPNVGGGGGSVIGTKTSTESAGGAGGFFLPNPIASSGNRNPGNPPTCFESPDWGCDCAPDHMNGSICVCMTSPMPQTTCKMGCSMGGCYMQCDASSWCELDCPFGCDAECLPGSTCMIGCGSDCSVFCHPGSQCTVFPSMSAFVTIWCELGAVCECFDPMQCQCLGPGCPQL